MYLCNGVMMTMQGIYGHDLKMGTSPRRRTAVVERRGTRHAHSTLPDDERLWNYARMVMWYTIPWGGKKFSTRQDFDFRPVKLRRAYYFRIHTFSFPLISNL